MLVGGLSGQSRLAARLSSDSPNASGGPRRTLKGDDLAVEALLKSLAD